MFDACSHAKSNENPDGRTFYYNSIGNLDIAQCKNAFGSLTVYWKHKNGCLDVVVHQEEVLLYTSFAQHAFPDMYTEMFHVHQKMSL
jgi:hypothetical protein